MIAMFSMVNDRVVGMAGVNEIQCPRLVIILVIQAGVGYMSRVWLLDL